MTKKFSVLMVCTGNICRSPSAEAVLQKALDETGGNKYVHVDSAGTEHWNIGDAPDPRSQKHAARRGIDMGHLRARQVTHYDLDEFDLILCMDKGHKQAVSRLAADEAQRGKVRLYLDFSEKFYGQNMADPYYGGDAGFEHVLDQIEDATARLIKYFKDNGIIRG